MNEINIILDSNIELDDSLITLKNDKEILFNKINKTLNLLNLDSSLLSNEELIQFKLLDILYNDNYIDFLSDIDITYLDNTNNFENDILNKLNYRDKNSVFSKKIIIKKILDFFNPIIDVNDIKDNSLHLNKNKLIINKNDITLNYNIEAKYINKKVKSLELKNYNIPKLNSFSIHGLYNNKIQFNIPYMLNEFSLEFNNIFNEISNNIHLYIKNLNYNNKTLFSLDTVDINDLIKLYKYTLVQFQLYNNNKIILHNIPTIINNNISDEIKVDNEELILFFNKYKYNTKSIDIDKCNNFLTNKIGNYFSNNIYNSFNNDGLLYLYENIYLYSLNNENIQKIIKKLLDQQKYKLEYQNNLLILENKLLLNYKLEYITKKKFPNLFNINSKENLFNKFNKFDINKIPKKIKDVILLDLKKNEDFIQNQLYNKCKHKNVLKSFYNSINKYNSFNELLKYIKKDINKESNKSIYKCNLCSFNLICPHIIDYYILYFNKNYQNKNDDYIHLKILNKYMSKAPIDMIYYCKVCGEELGKSYDMEQNIEFKDNVRVNTLEYSDDTSIMIQNTVSYIVYTYLSFKGVTMQINKTQIIRYIIENISLYVNNIEKKLRKSKNYDSKHESKTTDLIKFNIIIFTYSCIIFIMNKYPNLIFNKINKAKKLDNIIIEKQSNSKKGSKKGSKNNYNNTKGGISANRINNIKDNFREAYDLIISTNYLLLSQLDYTKNTEIIKNILVKSYTFINNSNELELDIKKNNNLELLLNSSIYKYYYNIANIYPLLKDNLNGKRKNIGIMVNYTDIYKSSLKKIKYDDYKNILGNIDVDKKPDYLFEKFNIPKFLNSTNLESIEKLSKINSYSEYKYYSILLFTYFINHRLYELPIYEFIELDKEEKKVKHLSNIYLDKIKSDIDINFLKYKDIVSLYISKTLIIKEFELQLIKNNIQFNQYPYSNIKLNNSRYYYTKNIELNKYICKKDSNLHNYNIYIYLLNNKEYSINKKDIDKKQENLNIVLDPKVIFKDYQCSKCELRKKSTYDYNNTYILNIIYKKYDIIQFYNIYRYKCPLGDFHIFKNNVCKICKITSNDILQNNINIFEKFKNNYKKYLNNILSIQNINILNIINENKKLLNTNIIDNYKQYINNDSNIITQFIDEIDKLNIDDLIIYISKISNIDIKYFKILGLTEGINYSDITLIEPSYVNIDNRFIKILNYIRTLSIYTNLLINIEKITSYYDYEFLEIINEIKLSNKDTFIKQIKINNNINLIEMFNFIKLTNNDNKYIIEFGLKMLFNKIKEINELNNKLDNFLEKYLNFIINQLFKYDELFTNYNYGELKQMFTENIPGYEDDYENNNYENTEDDDDGLFSYNDIDVEFGDVED